VVCISQEECEKHLEYISDFGTIKWNLKINKQIAYNVGYGAGSFFRSIKAFEVFWHAEGMKSEYEGDVILNGEKFIVMPSTSFGYADKNWERTFTSPWVWLSSNNLRSLKTGSILENSVFDIGGGRPKVGSVALKRKLLSSFCYEGKEYEFNFSKFWTFTRTAFDCKETEEQIIWHVEQKTLFNRMVTDITSQKEDMLLVNYEAPDGTKRHNRLWNGGNGRGKVRLYHWGKLIDEVLVLNADCEYGEYTL
jgi:hypothetical protein